MATRAQLNISLTTEEAAELERIAGAAGFTPVELARKAVKAVLEFCADGRIPTGNLRLVSPAYRIVGDRVVDASPVYPIFQDAEERRAAEISEVEAMADADDARRAQAEAVSKPAPAEPPVPPEYPHGRARRAIAPASGVSRPASAAKKPAATQVGTGRGAA